MAGIRQAGTRYRNDLVFARYSARMFRSFIGAGAMELRYVCLGLAMAVSGSATVAHAQAVNFTCPRAGVTEERGLGKLQYTGAAANDPLVCNRLNYKTEPESR